MLIVAACTRGGTDVSAPIADPLPTTAPVIAAEALQTRGQIVESWILPDLLDDPGQVIGEARRAVYRSVSGLDGGVREVSGAFFRPPGQPPVGGWPVISIGHGTTGIGTDCGPSQESDLLGFWPMVRSYLGEGYAVAMTDYEGLGHSGHHPYLEPHSAAFNVIDAVRALRQLFTDASARWLGFGNSQGGQAVWASNEVATQYGAGLELVGTVALSPAANVTAMADLAGSQSLTAEQEALLPLVAGGVARYNPKLVEESLLPRLTAEQESRAFSCGADAETLRDELIPPESISLDDERSVAVFRTALRRIALPQTPLSAPMLVINGLADQTILPQWVTAAVEESCRLGGRIQHVEVADAGHGDLGAAAYDVASTWVRDRFAGLPAASTCGDAATVLPAE
ncbi:Uncharacterised protein [Mycolicibacterium vanbaalenii]|uniref:Inactive lipase n=1 Tax=Mycolicibacterium vanbaalenii TaxID=110539 RepID=A0A5S9R2R9_MYCVN|nr:lipase family protein [Mycolicibacterium vanbaalenii]CAA0128257.1 Uncharacterised protein [Mycolicibacterium vanbaalenii]